MGPPGILTWTWAPFVCLSWMFVGRVVAGPWYIVAIPAVIEAGADTRFCASLLQPTETLVMTITLHSQQNKTVLFQKTSSSEFHTCAQFQAQSMQNNEVQNFKVVVQGDTFYSEEVRRVMIKFYRPMTFIQTDKPIYLPGQTVHFRVISLDTRFRPANALYNVIEITDSHQNRIGQWLNTSSNGKILQLSYSLNSEARQGNYVVNVWTNENIIFQHFKVEKYVLPKFDIKVNASDIISFGETDIKVEVCARYTYGQPVPGSVDLSMCLSARRLEFAPEPSSSGECYSKRKQTDKTGCAMFMIEMSTLTKMNQVLLSDELYLQTTVEEEGTGVSRTHQKRIALSYSLGKLSFTDIPLSYSEGSILEGKVKAVYFNNSPISDRLVHLLDMENWSGHLLQNLTTDSHGIAAFSLNTTNHKGIIRLCASLTPRLGPRHRTLHYESAHHTSFLVWQPTPHSKTVSSLTVMKKKETLPCDKTENISIEYTIVGETPGFMDVIYLILSRGTIVTQGFTKVEVQNDTVTEGEVSFMLKVSPEMAPHFQVVAYALLPGENVVAHSADFSTEKCFSHKVSLEFSPSSAVPGEETTMQVRAHSNSLCGVSAIDQSVLIKEPGKILDANRIFDLLPVMKASSFPHEVEDPQSCLSVRQRRTIMPYPGHGIKKDAYSVFKDLGLKMATNMLLKIPLCVNFKGTVYYHSGPFPSVQHQKTGAGAMLGSHLGSGIMETVRTFFPETWIWKMVEVGESGTTDVPLTVPDTITTWETEAFCLSPQGFGLAPRKEITVFQPFFLDLRLPHSIIRGENFELKATIYNYLPRCIMVTVTPAPSLDYTLTPLSGDQYTSCLCASERKTLSWTMLPSALGVVNVTVTAEAVASHMTCDNEVVSVPDRGRIDSVTRSLIVKAEGTELTKTYNWLFCPKGKALIEELELQLPENMINGSAHASVSVLGDILGRALRNLDGLLKMPYGCGEQNMALLAPNIYILQYLKSTKQLTQTIEEKANNFLTSGYQRQLNYRHRDGAYSTFGDGKSNTWLTAFVLRSFVKAQSFVYIDPVIIRESERWLKRNQQKNGCFIQLGTLFHNRMKGGVSDEVTLSAYITAAFLEMNMPVNHSSVQRSLSCLNESISNLNNTYTTALLAYVFTLAGDMETRAHLLQHLDTVALREGSFLHWSQTTEMSDSLSVEISSYVLLAKLSASPTAEELGSATSIVRWLIGQQNTFGGFSSTQDTVVALQALALFATLVFSLEGSSTVTVQSPTVQIVFDVNRSNKLLYQEEVLKSVTGYYSVEVKGSACASVQISLHYNVPTPADVSTFSVEVKTVSECQFQRHKVTLQLTSLYRGKEKSTNMVIVDIKMLSGFVPDPWSLQLLNYYLLVKRVDQKDDHVLMYMERLLKDTPVDHTLELIQELPVQNLKPAVVKIYDYYQPSDQAETEYTHLCPPDTGLMGDPPHILQALL